MRNPLGNLCNQLGIQPNAFGLNTKEVRAALSEDPRGLKAFLTVLAAMGGKIRIESVPLVLTISNPALDALMSDDAVRASIGMKPFPADIIDHRIYHLKPDDIPQDEFWRRHIIPFVIARMLPDDPRAMMRFDMEMEYGEKSTTIRAKAVPAFLRDLSFKNLRLTAWFRDRDWHMEGVTAQAPSEGAPLPVLNKYERWMLLGAMELKAFSEGMGQSAVAISRQARAKPMTDPVLYESMTSLRTKGLMLMRDYWSPVYWLSEAGKVTAERLMRD